MTNWAARLFARAIDLKLKPLGLSSGHMPVIFALGDGKALSQRALTEAAAIEQPTMAATLSRMERDGLVEKRPDPNDRRSQLYSLTPLATSKLDGVRAAMTEVNSDATEGLSDEERERYSSILSTVVKNLEPSRGS